MKYDLPTLLFALFFSLGLVSDVCADQSKLNNLLSECFPDEQPSELVKIFTSEYNADIVSSRIGVGFLSNFKTIDEITTQTLEIDPLIRKSCELRRSIDRLSTQTISGTIFPSDLLLEMPELTAIDHFYFSYLKPTTSKIHNKDGVLSIEYKEDSVRDRVFVNINFISSNQTKSFYFLRESTYNTDDINTGNFSLLTRHSLPTNKIDGIWVLGTFDSTN